MQSLDSVQSIGVPPGGPTLEWIPDQRDWKPFRIDDWKMSEGGSLSSCVIAKLFMIF